MAIVLLRFGRAVVPQTRLHLFVLAFAAANLVSAVLAENAYIALFGEREKYLGLTFLADMLVLYGAVAISYRRPADWALLAIAIGLAGAVSIGYAVVQGLGLDPVHWDRSAERPSGTFGNPDMLGHFLSLIFGGALGVAAFASGRRSLLPRVAAASVAGIALVGATAIATRGSLIGFVAALAVAALIHMKARGVSRLTVERMALRGLAALVLLTGVIALTPIADRVRTTVEGHQVRERLLLYESALRALADRPVFGYGPDNFAVAHPRYRQAESIVLIGVGPETSAHSWPFQAAATLGLVGLAALLALIWVAARSLWSRGLARAPALAVPVLLASAAYLAHGLVTVDTISLDWWLWVALGASAALGANAVAAPPGTFRIPKLAAAWSLVGLALVASLTGITALRSNQNALTAKLAWEEGRGEPARVAAEASVRLDPGRADHWNWLGLALDLQGQWRAAGDAFAEAAARAPHEAAYWSNQARSRAREALSSQGSGDGAAALEAARKAVATDPNSPEASAVLAEIASLFGEYELALDAAIRAIRLYPNEPSFDFIAAEGALGLSDQETAQKKLEELIVVRDSATLRVTAARLALTRDDRPVARLHARRALELDPRNSAAIAILKEAGG